jgi:hypothetical protein
MHEHESCRVSVLPAFSFACVCDLEKFGRAQNVEENEQSLLNCAHPGLCIAKHPRTNHRQFIALYTHKFEMMVMQQNLGSVDMTDSKSCGVSLASKVNLTCARVVAQCCCVLSGQWVVSH